MWIFWMITKNRKTVIIAGIQIDDSEIKSVLILWDKEENIYLCFYYVLMVSFELFYFSISFCVSFQLSNNLSFYFLITSFFVFFNCCSLLYGLALIFWFFYYFSGILCVCLAFCSLSMFIDLSIHVLSSISLLIEPLLLLGFIYLVI